MHTALVRGAAQSSCIQGWCLAVIPKHCMLTTLQLALKGHPLTMPITVTCRPPTHSNQSTVLQKLCCMHHLGKQHPSSDSGCMSALVVCFIFEHIVCPNACGDSLSYVVCVCCEPYTHKGMQPHVVRASCSPLSIEGQTSTVKRPAHVADADPAASHGVGLPPF